MTIDNIIEQRHEIEKRLKAQRLHDTFTLLSQLIDATTKWKLHEELDELEMSYKYMLQYMEQGIDDPKRPEIYAHISNSLHTLLDRTVIELLSAVSFADFYIAIRNNYRINKSLSELLADFNIQREKSELYANVDEEHKDKDEYIRLLEEKENVERNIFYKIWTSFPISNGECDDIKAAFADENMPVYMKTLMISALYLALNCFFDESKLLLLLELYGNKNEEIQMKSLCCAMLAMYMYSDRIASSRQVQIRIEAMMENAHFQQDVKSVYLQLIRCRDTEKITRKVQDELLPGLMKASPEIFKKMKGGGMAIDLSDVGANPEWQDILDKSGFSKKIEELSELQMEGGDVFMGTFSHLKSFPFFAEIANWFLPFHQGHSIIESSSENGKNVLSGILENTNFLCDSDKFSFGLSLATMPEMQRKMIMSQFSSQNAEIMEMRAAELPDPAKKREWIANKYIQDLYRFFKLYKHSSQFANPFVTSLDFLEVKALKPILSERDTQRLIGEYFLKHEHYDEAAHCFLALLDDESSPQLYQKIGFCYQNLGDYTEAINYYSKSELLDVDNIWTHRHMALCYKLNKNPEKALEFYMKAAALDPENMAICLNIGHCLLETGNAEEALKYYFKVDYNDNGKHRAWRPIAWCSFIVGNYNQSRSYFEKIINDDKPTAQDYLNFGHLSLAEKKYGEALSSYKESILKDGRNIEGFISALHSDEKYLLAAGVVKDEIPMLIDKVLYNIE
jgi:tetratricopeptide (TPR) repeat protein